MTTAKPKEAPGELAVVRAFVNSNDIDEGTDDLSSPDDLDAWLRDQGLLEDAAAATAASLRGALAFREALRSLLVANNFEAPVDPDAVATLNRVAERARPAVRIDADGRGRLEATAPGVDGALGRLLLIAYRAMEDGTWHRLKACRNDTCRWAFYDHSKNQSATWCTMAVCGSQMKARAYRRRKAGAQA